MSNSIKAVQTQEREIDYQKVTESADFKALMKKKKRFLVPTSIFFLLFYISLPVLTSFTTVLEGEAIGSITWTWVYSFLQFVMTWVLCMVYVNRSSKYDKMAQKIVENHHLKGDQ